jgi:hypothetical protein
MERKEYQQIASEPITAEPASPIAHPTTSTRATVDTPLLSPVAASSSVNGDGNAHIPKSSSSTSITIQPDLRRVNRLVYERVDGKEGKDGKRGPPPKRPDGQQGLSMKRLLAQAKPERCILIIATVFLFLGAIVSLATPAFVGAIIDAISASASDKDVVDTWVAKLGFGDSPDNVLTVSIIGLAIAVSSSSFFTMVT